MDLNKEEIVTAARQAGIAGAGGGGFPAHIKLSSHVDTVIGNGAECEPLLQSDKFFMRLFPELVLDGIKVVMKATGASRGIIAVKGHYKEVVQALENILVTENTISLHLLENVYPAGDEFFTVYETTGRLIGEGGHPPDVGVVVHNVISLGQIAEAVSGKAVVERLVTVNGEVKNPQVISAPIGTTYRDLIQIAGGVTEENYVVFDGGPMMGHLVNDLQSGIAKTTSGIIVLPKEHFIARMKLKTPSQMVKLSKAACCQCERCTDLCSRYLLGHKLYPHMTMRTIDYNQAEPTSHITSAFLCSQCGLCELVACDFMLLSPRKIYAEYRRKLVEAGIRNPHQRKEINVHSLYQERKVPIEMLLKKLALSKYSGPLRFTGSAKISSVKIPVSRHTGVPAVPLVNLGSKVKRGDLIATPPEGKLGAFYHASISGQVVEITEHWIGVANY